MAENFGPGLLGGVVLIDPQTGQPYRAEAGSGSGGSGDTIDYVALTGPYTFTPDIDWETNAGHMVVFTQDAVGGRVVSFASTVAPADNESLPAVSTVSDSESSVGFVWSPAISKWIPTLMWVVTPPDVIDPIAGTLASSAITSSGFTLTATGASDARGLDTLPYRFSTNNGSTWSNWQGSGTYVVTGATQNTAYTCLHEVRDAAGNTTVGTSIVVTTSVAVVGSYTSSGIDAADLSTYTFAAKAIGTAAANRNVIVGFTWRAGSAVTVTGVTVGGIAATQDVATNQANSGVWIGRAVVPTGTTADVVVTLSGAAVRAGVGVWRVAGTVAVSGSTGSGTNTATVTVPAGGYAVAMGIGQTDGSALAMTGFTQNFATQIESPGGLPFYAIGGAKSTAGSGTATTAISNAGTNATAAVAYAVS